MHVVETLAHSEETLLTLDGKTVAVPCITEDDDGIRWLLTTSYATMTAYQWQRAVVSGVAALIEPHGSGWRAVPVETFMDGRSERGEVYTWDATWDRVWGEWPTYPSLLTGSVVVEVGEPERPNGGKGSLGFTHLHTHTEYSALDGRSRADEVFSVVAGLGQRAVAITDHGICAGHPGWQRWGEKTGIKAIFGIEAYLVDNRFRRPVEWWEDRETGQRVTEEVFAATTVEQRKKKFERKTNAKQVHDEYWHLVLLAENDQGLKNIWAASTESFRDGQYYTPKMDWDTLARHVEGVIALTGCLRGPVADPIVKGEEEQARQSLGRLMEIYGPDHLFLEVMPNDLEDQTLVNKTLARFAEEYHLPLVATVDSHYPTRDMLGQHKAWIAVQTNEEVGDEGDLFAKDLGLYLKSEQEVREGLGRSLEPHQVEEAIEQTGIIAARCTAEIPQESHLPVYSKKGGADRDAERLLDLCLSNWHLTTGKDYGQEEAMARFEYEFGMLVRKGFCGYFLQVADYVGWAKQNGCLVGPGRGSGGGSLVAYLARITGIDPIEAGLLFERFMTEGRTSLPDFDVDFPTSWRERVQDYITSKYGEDRVVRVGTHLRLKNKGIIQNLFRAMASELPEETWRDQKAISDIIGAAEASTAGLGLSWEELMTQEEDLLQPFIDRYPVVFEMAEHLVKILKSYGKHPAGLVVSTDASLIESLPLRLSDEADGRMITQFEMADLEAMGYIKFDLLTLRTLDTIQETVDLIEANRGVRIDVDNWKVEYEDPQVWEELSEGHTLGVFQIETPGGKRLTQQVRPQNLSDLSDTLTVVRPGPRRSGLMSLYLARRHGKAEVTYPDPRLEKVLGRTYGCILYQEDVMQTTMILAGYDSNRADEVRKILGKKKVELVVAAGQEFVEGCVVNGMDRQAATALWEQLGEFAKYCITGDSEIHLAGTNHHQQTLNVEQAWRRLHIPLRPPVVGRTKSGEEFAGPCDACGATASHHWVRGRCNACYVWWQKFHERGVYALSYYADERIRPARILDVIHNGVREVYQMTLSDGSSIKATSNHRFLTDKGYRRVEDLALGDRVRIDGGCQMPTTEEVARRNRVTRGERQAIGAINGRFGPENYGYIDGGHVVWQQWREQTPRICAQCGEDEAPLQQAHLNGDHQDQRWENYAWLCRSCHLRYDYARNHRTRRWQRGHLVDSAEIIAIGPAGREPVYDVVMEAPHNFVVNNVVSHNSFGRAHAWGYAVLAYWTAWLKTHYPVEFFTSVLSTVKAERIPEFVGEARRMGFSILPPDINDSGKDFTCQGLNVRYGLLAVPGLGEPTVAPILAGQPYSSFEDFRERSEADKGVQATLVKIGAFDSMVANRRGLETLLLQEKTGVSVRCVNKDETVTGAPNDLPCVFDWASEPAPVNERTGKTLKKKDPPKRCTRACRHYTAPEALDITTVEPYTEEDVRNIEMEVLGLHLSSTVFDRITDEEKRELLRSQAETLINLGIEDRYLLAVTISKVRQHIDRNGKSMAFIGMVTEIGEVEAVAFSSTWERYHHDLQVGRLLIVDVTKQPGDKGVILDYLAPPA